MKRATALILLACTSLVTLLCPAPELSAKQGRAEIQDVYVVHFVLDGTNREVFQGALEKGLLPTLTQELKENGTSFDAALSAFPSVSPCIYQSYVTGLWPGHAGIPFLERLDRKSEKVFGYLTVNGHNKTTTDLINLRALQNPDVATLHPGMSIFELLKGHPTAAIFSSFSGEASEIYPTADWIRAGWATFVSKQEEMLDVLAMRHVMKLFARPVSDIPRYSLVGLYASDSMGHTYGPQSEEVLLMLRQFDVFLHDFLQLLQTQGIRQKTFIIISADHGMHQTGKLLKLNEALTDAGIAVRSTNLKRQPYTLYAANRGVASTQIFVKLQKPMRPLERARDLRALPTREGKSVDLIRTLQGLDATELIIVRNGPQRVRVYNRDGRSATIACSTVHFTDYCSYLPDTPTADPLGYADLPRVRSLLDGTPHSSREWRMATFDADYPDAVMAFTQIFRDGRAGDLFLTTRPPYGLRKIKNGTHGGASKEDMNVPLLIIGSGMKGQKAHVAHPMDLFPLQLDWFGLHVADANHDGVHPFKSRPPEDPRWREIALLDELLKDHPPLAKMIDAASFVQETIAPRVPLSHFRKLLPYAQQECARRSALEVKLLQAQADLRQEQHKRKRRSEKESLTEELTILEREVARAQEGRMRLEDLQSILKACHGRPATCHF